ncbi:MAG: response regulator [Alphaproteobacteria bacterium]|nr:response regulator [Alphaproteobacteria bacterium]
MPSAGQYDWFSSDLIEILPAAVYVCDADGVVVAYNQRATELWGRTPEPGDTDEKYCGSHKLFRPNGTYLPHPECPMEWVLRTGEMARDQEVIIERPDGFRVTVLVNIAPLFDRGGALRGAVNCFQDLSAQKRAEAERTQLREQLLQAQKVEALGRLTGGLAHDFNNLLAAISGNLELLEPKLNDPAASQILARATEAATQGARLVEQILAFSRRQTLDPHPIDVGEIILKMKDTLGRTLGGDVRIEIRCEPGLWPVSSDETQFELAILNLVVNARDAMPYGGPITVVSANVPGVRSGEVAGLRPGDYVRVSVTDRGHGMSADVLQRVFEPYFTTKERGKGTGMGLSMVHGMMAQLGGTVIINSRVGHGTSVSIFLPRAEANLPERQDADASPPSQGAGRILIVEDEPGVLDFLGDALSNLGYAVFAVKDTDSAVSIVEEDEQLDAVICDYKLPKMTGAQLLARMCQTRPGLKGMLVTGNPDAIEQTNFPVLKKPFSLATLAERVLLLLHSKVQ